MVTPVKQLLPELGRVVGVRRKVPRTELRALYDAGDYKGVVDAVKRGMGLDMRLFLARTHKVPPGLSKKAVAWVTLPEKYMPPYGSKEFRAMFITVSIRHSFMNTATFEEFVTVVAHELSHIVLDSIGNVWKRHEPAVDLTAMLLGYGEFYEEASSSRSRSEYFVSPFEMCWKKRLLSWCAYIFLPRRRMYTESYLSREEIAEAAKWIRFNRR